MGVLKEELKVFEDLYNEMPPWTFYNTANPAHKPNLQKLRYWGIWCNDMRVEKTRQYPNAVDAFFFAFEQDGVHLLGTMLKIFTTWNDDGSKTVELKIFPGLSRCKNIFENYKKYASANAVIIGE